MQRLFHYTFLALIGLSLALQTLGLLGDMSGDTTGILHSVAEAGAVLVGLGTVAAFLKLLLNLVRSVRQRDARWLALAYAAVLAWPLLLGAVKLASNVQAQAQVVEMPTPEGGVRKVLQQREPELPPSPEFVAGQAWADEHRPAVGADCKGSGEFRRGCFIRMQDQRKAQEAAGRAWAEQQRPQRISQCKGDSVHAVLGCLKWLQEQPDAPRGWPFGATSTAECEVEVNANYETARQLYIAEGNPHGAEVNRRRHWLPDLRQCQLIDRHVQDPMMVQAYSRLAALVSKLQQRAPVTSEEDAAFRSDYTEMAKVPDQPYKEAYLRLAAEYLERQGGVFTDNSPPPLQLSCEEFATRLETMRQADASRVEEMRALKGADGIVRDGRRHDLLNRQRIEMLWEWKLVTDGAKAAGCPAAI
ncbi:hypothetical protein [Ideonella sp.]|uniref:hypothetical protein n=1 Tax=Ideonella sp. TaxID=1929293 RepID=UPI002B47A823|nr:hypothetical protein [Ideonella sp.]HJV70041.1 hypothetical protein [Ideonella sp.]